MFFHRSPATLRRSRRRVRGPFAKVRGATGGDQTGGTEVRERFAKDRGATAGAQAAWKKARGCFAKVRSATAERRERTKELPQPFADP